MPGLGESPRARSAFDQGNPQLAFEVTDLLRQRRLCDVQPLLAAAVKLFASAIARK